MAGGREEIAEVLASHYLEAIRADADADDVTALRASAREALAWAGHAAASLALGPEAQRYFDQAAELAEGDVERVALFEQAGVALGRSGDADGAEQALRHAIELGRRAGRASGGSAAVALAASLRAAGRLEEARALVEPFLTLDDTGADKVVRAEALAELATVHIFGGDPEAAGPLLDEALTTLEQERAWPALATALIGQAIHLLMRHRVLEADAILRLALSLAQEHDLPAVALRARHNLAGLALGQDRLADTISEVEPGLALARERGDRFYERILLAQSLMPLVGLGRWDEAAPIGEALISGELDLVAIWAATCCAQIAGERGDDDALDRCRAIASHDWDSTHGDARASVMLLGARVALERGAAREALALARPILDIPSSPGEFLAEAFAILVAAALSIPDDAPIAELEAFVTALAPARATPQLRAGRARLAAERAQRRGDAAAAERHETEAIELLRAMGARPLLAQALTERARRRADADARAEARRIYTELGATAGSPTSANRPASRPGAKAASRPAGQRPARTAGSAEVEPVEVQDLDPRGDEVRHELLARVIAGVDLGERAQLGVRAEHEVDAGAGPADLARGVVADERPRVAGGRRPRRAEVEQVHEEVVRERAGVSVRTPAVDPPAFAPRARRPPTSTVISGALSVSRFALSTSRYSAVSRWSAAR